MITSSLEGKTILFLDVGGVIHDGNGKDPTPTERAQEYFHVKKPSHDQLDFAATYDFSETALDLLNFLIERIQSVAPLAIVMSSEYREKRTPKDLREKIFRRCDFASYIVDKTPDSDEKPKTDNRSKQIDYWLKKHPEIRQFIILDDWDDDLSTRFPRNYVQIDTQNLLSLKDVEKACRLLKIPLSPTLPKKPKSYSSCPTVVFLNVGGVLYSHTQYRNRNQSTLREKYPKIKVFSRDQFAQDLLVDYNFQAVDRLHRFMSDLQKKTPAAFVLSSTLRLDRSPDQIRDILPESIAKSVICKTPDSLSEKQRASLPSHCQGRAAEIAYWLKMHPETIRFVIFDDQEGEAVKFFPKNSISINPYSLLTEKNIERAYELLNVLDSSDERLLKEMQPILLKKEIDLLKEMLEGAGILPKGGFHCIDRLMCSSKYLSEQQLKDLKQSTYKQLVYDFLKTVHVLEPHPIELLSLLTLEQQSEVLKAREKELERKSNPGFNKQFKTNLS